MSCLPGARDAEHRHEGEVGQEASYGRLARDAVEDLPVRVGDVVIRVVALGHRLAALLDDGHFGLEVGTRVAVGAPDHLEAERDGRGAGEHTDGDRQPCES